MREGGRWSPASLSVHSQCAVLVVDEYAESLAEVVGSLAVMVVVVVERVWV